jgi:hypothetical protein
MANEKGPNIKKKQKCKRLLKKGEGDEMPKMWWDWGVARESDPLISVI